MKRSAARSLPGDLARDAEPETDLAGALHEVSNALTVVLGWLDAAHAGLPEGPEANAIDVARTHARLGHHIARRAIGAEVPTRRERTARSIARCAVLGVSQEAQRRGLSVELDEPDRCRVLLQDTEPVLQILLNLLLNAIEFSPEGSVVTLSLRDDTTGVVFTVSDRGPGIDPERADTLLSSPDSTRRGGAGLGLRYSSALAKAKGGELKLLPSRPGASFALRWPISEARSGAYQPRAPLPTLVGTRILVVEDDAAVMSLIEVALEARGATLVSVANAAQFDAMIAGRVVFDAALIDLSPIAKDVPSALAALSRTNPGSPVILISGVASAVPCEVADRVAAWVRKPFEMGEVVGVLTHLLGDRSPKSDR